MKKGLIYLSLIVITAFTINACKKDKQEVPDTTQDTDVETAQDNSLAEGSFNDVNSIASEAVQNGSVTSFRLSRDPSSILSACATIIPVSPGNVKVDFGTTPCQCIDYRYRKGIINISYTGLYRDSNAVITITFDNYYVGNNVSNMYKVMGTKTVTNKGHNASGHLWYEINVNGSLENTAGHTMTWNSTRQREWIAGESTGVWGDDEYMISGSINGTNFLGNSFIINITQPLHVDLGCRWIKDGKFEFTPSGHATRYVDYGNGTCDANAIVTISNFTFPITLP